MAANGARALIFLINVVFSLYLAALFVRVILQRLGADYYNPIVQFVVRITDPVVRPLRRVLPGIAGWDVAGLVLAVAFAFLNAWLVISLAGFGAPVLWIAHFAGKKLLAVLINLYIFSILIQALLSWLNPRQYSPLAVLLWRMNEPLLRPVRRILPPIGGTIDLSPLVVIIALEALSIFLGLPGYL